MHKSQAAGCQLDVVSFSSTLSACEKAWRWRWALESLKSTSKRLISVDRTLLNSAISATERGSQWLQASYLALDMSRFHCEPSIISFNAACNAMLKASWIQALQLFEWAMKNSLEADRVSGNELLKALRWPQTLSLLRFFHLNSMKLDDLALRITLEKLQEEPRQLVKLLERSSDRIIDRFPHISQRFPMI